METGYYWARVDNADWEIIEVIRTESPSGAEGRMFLVHGVEAVFPVDAVTEWGPKVTRTGNVVMTQYGENCTQITNVGTMTIK